MPESSLPKSIIGRFDLVHGVFIDQFSILSVNNLAFCLSILTRDLNMAGATLLKVGVMSDLLLPSLTYYSKVTGHA